MRDLLQSYLCLFSPNIRRGFSKLITEPLLADQLEEQNESNEPSGPNKSVVENYLAADVLRCLAAQVLPSHVAGKILASGLYRNTIHRYLILESGLKDKLLSVAELHSTESYNARVMLMAAKLWQELGGTATIQSLQQQYTECCAPELVMQRLGNNDVLNELKTRLLAPHEHKTNTNTR